MKRNWLLASMCACVAGVLAISLIAVRRQRVELLERFRLDQQAVFDDTADSIRQRMGEVARDAHFLASLVEETRGRADLPAVAQDRAIASAFRALATSVAHYRTVVAESTVAAGDSRETLRPVIAVDPSEMPAVAEALIARCRQLLATSARDGLWFSPPVGVAGRDFYLFGTRARTGDGVAVSIDAKLLLTGLFAPAPPERRAAVIDPSGTAWLGCETAEGCRRARAQEWQALSAGAGLRTERRLRTPVGELTLAMVADTTALVHRQRLAVAQLLLTTAGVVASLVVFGGLLLRQQGRAAELAARLRTAEEIAELQRQLVRAEKLVTVGALSAGLAHEIGTPLMVVRGRAENLLELETEAEARQDLQAIVAQIDRISATVRKVLDFAHAEPQATVTVDALAVARAATELLALRLETRGVTVQVSGTGSTLVSADASQLEQVFVNLIVNACDASASGGVVDVRLGPGLPGHVRFEVEDRGSGIRPEHLNAIFDPYFTTKKQGEGVGLGLAVVAQILRTHHAEISLRSAPGEGTLAIIEWPAPGPSASGTSS